METDQEISSLVQEKIAFLIANNERLSEENLNLKTETFELKTRLEETEKKLNWFIEQIKLGKQRQFANKNEASKYLQLEFDLSQAFDEEDEYDRIVDTQIINDTEIITYTRKKKTVGRRIDTSKLPREKIIHDLSLEEKICKCGNELKKFGEDRSEQLEYIPATVKVIEHICSKYTCQHCETIRTVSKSESPIAKCMASPSLISEVIISKFEHHIPWYRQSKIFTSNGLDIPANTICNWFMQAGEVLEPLKEALTTQTNNTDILQADETPVKVLKNNTRGFMWCCHSLKPDNRFVFFNYSDSRSGKFIEELLKDYQGILQTDGYSGYNSMRV